jgi:alkanesulfonate monooxygenase SsuD/methylene tetrahydromethanopterin reductase-like flavin-dependent oxidoreductase (luciferase family)
VTSRYGRPLEFGLSLVPTSADIAVHRQVAARADELGLDLIGIQDHPYQWRFLDTWALIGDLLARTERVRLFPDVANLPLRPPAMLAKQAATLDVLSAAGSSWGWGRGPSGRRSARWAGPSARQARRYARSRRRSA